MKSEGSPSAKLALFVNRFSPDVAALARAARVKLRKRLPRAVEMVYDNSYALVIGYGPTERPSDAIVSIVIYPKKVSVCFLHGKQLADPDRLLQGEGKQVRWLPVDRGAAVLDAPAVRALVDEAIAFGGVSFAGRHRLVIRAVSPKRRARR